MYSDTGELHALEILTRLTLHLRRPRPYRLLQFLAKAPAGLLPLIKGAATCRMKSLDALWIPTKAGLPIAILMIRQSQ
jgi:hypothetical protein